MHIIQEQMAFADAKGLFRCVSAHDVISCLLPEILRTGTSYRSAPRTSHVDCFVSHSWSSPRWMKILAVCHHLNLGLATVSSAMVSVLTAVILVVSKGSFNDVAQMPQIQLYTYLVFWPIGVFLLAYFFGHLCGSKTFWFDQVCVDQVNALVKVQTLRAIPASWILILQST